MNNKTTAVVMALAMAFVGFAVMAVDGADGADTTSKDVSVTVGASDSVMFAVTEGNYSYYNYTLTWKMSIESVENSETTILTVTKKGSDITCEPKQFYVNASGISDTSSDETSSDEYNFSIEMKRDETNIGVYTMNVTGVAATSAINYNLTASIVISLPGDNGGSRPIDNFAQYSGSVIVFPGEGGKFTATISGLFTVGTYNSASIAVEAMDLTKYDWYAVGLPAGLTMSPNGTVSGIPTVAYTDGDLTIRLFATGEDGKVIEGVLTGLSVSEQKPVIGKYTCEVYLDDDNGVNLVTAPYIFQNGETIKLKVVSSGGQAVDNAVVTVISTADDQNTTTSIPCSGGFYTLPSTGSGAYTVQITWSGQIETFSVYIIGEASAISADIVIVGGN